MFNIKSTFNVSLSTLYSLTKSLIYVLELIVCTNHLQINIFQIIIVNTKYIYLRNYK